MDKSHSTEQGLRVQLRDLMRAFIPPLLSILPLLCAPAMCQVVDKDYNAETMLKLCSGTVPDMAPDAQSMVCTFRLNGLISAMTANCGSIAEGYNPAPVLTAGNPASRGAARQAFKNYMEDHPEQWGLPWHMVAAAAISSTFPCENVR